MEWYSKNQFRINNYLALALKPDGEFHNFDLTFDVAYSVFGRLNNNVNFFKSSLERIT